MHHRNEFRKLDLGLAAFVCVTPVEEVTRLVSDICTSIAAITIYSRKVYQHVAAAVAEPLLKSALVCSRSL